MVANLSWRNNIPPTYILIHPRHGIVSRETRLYSAHNTQYTFYTCVKFLNFWMAWYIGTAQNYNFRNAGGFWFAFLLLLLPLPLLLFLFMLSFILRCFHSVGLRFIYEQSNNQTIAATASMKRYSNIPVSLYEARYRMNRNPILNRNHYVQWAKIDGSFDLLQWCSECRPAMCTTQLKQIDGNRMEIVFYEMAFKRAINHAIANSNVSKIVCKSKASNWMGANEAERCVEREKKMNWTEPNRTEWKRDRWPHFTVMTNIVMCTQFHFQLFRFHFYFVELNKKAKRKSEHDHNNGCPVCLAFFRLIFSGMQWHEFEERMKKHTHSHTKC